MATATVPKNSDRTFRRAISIMQQPGGTTHANLHVGHATVERIKRRMWISAGAPAGAAPAAMAAGDWILDVTNEDVYWYVTGTTYVKLNQIT